MPNVGDGLTDQVQITAAAQLDMQAGKKTCQSAECNNDASKQLSYHDGHQLEFSPQRRHLAGTLSLRSQKCLRWVVLLRCTPAPCL